MGVDVEGVEDRRLEIVGAGRDRDVAVAGGEVVDADPVELAERPAGGDDLAVDVRVTDAGGGELVGDDGFDHRGVDADGDVTVDVGLAPVEHGAQAEEVFHHLEAVFDVGEALVVATTSAVDAWSTVSEVDRT